MNINSRVYLFLIKRFLPVLLCCTIAVYVLYYYVLSGIPLFSDYSVWPGLFLLAGAALSFVTLNLVIKSQIRVIDKILSRDCDPEAYTAIYREMISRAAAMKRRADSSFMYNNLCAGLSASGKYQEALDILTSLKPQGAVKNGKLIEMVYQHNLCSIYLSMGDLEKARWSLQDVQKRLSELNLSGKTERLYQSRVQALQARLDIVEGRYGDAEHIFLEAFQLAESRREQVSLQYFLGQVYVHSGDAARAKEAFEYIISHGNKLHTVEEAKDILARLG